jgi:lipoate-protein ligase B
VATDLRYFDLIVPCGISDRKATSLEKLLSRSVSLSEVKPHLVDHLAELFSLAPRALSREELLAQLAQSEASAVPASEAGAVEKV